MEDYGNLVRRAAVRLVQTMDEPDALRALPRWIGFSPFHFHRLFLGLVGETPGLFLRRVRLERAAHALRTDQPTILAIALDAGFESHAAFTRAFKAWSGVSPSAFRRGAGRIPPSPSGWRWTNDGLLAPDSPSTPLTTMNVHLETHPPRLLLAVRHIGPYHLIPEAFDRLCRVVPADWWSRPGVTTLAAYYDDPTVTSAEELRSDAAITLPEGETAPVKLPEGTEARTLPGGPVARYVHLGPYSELESAWQRLLGEWLPASGRQWRDAPSYELYVGDPHRDSPELLRTDLIVPLQP